MTTRAMRNSVRKTFPLPSIPIPKGEMVDLPGRGSTFVTVTPGPAGAPTLLLLHAVGCTGLARMDRCPRARGPASSAPVNSPTILPSVS